jgi:hypothetical protein
MTVLSSEMIMAVINQRTLSAFMPKVESYTILFSILILFNMTTLFSEPLFQDDFSDPYFTTVSWILNDPYNCTMTFSENGIVLKNLHQFNSIIALHSLSKKYRNFSISTTISSESAGSGIFFNITTDQSGKINGYAALISFEKVELLKFSSGSHTTLASHTSTFIKSSDNVLTVSRKDSLILLFCNGYFLYSYCDNELPPGDCAMMIQPRSTTVFSNFEFQTAPLDSLSFKPFIDSFDKPPSFGWRKSGNGFSSIVDSSLEITTSLYENFLYTIDQPMDGFQLATDFLPKKMVSNDSSTCGLVITALKNKTDDSAVCIRIGFNGNRICILDGISSCSLIKSVLDTQDSTWERLQLIYENSLLRFYCDDNLFFESTIILNVTSAGLYSSKGSVARFDNFTLERPGVTVATHKNTTSFLPAGKVPLIKRVDQIFRTDLLGRSYHSLYENTGKKPAALMVHNNRKYISFTTFR